jgi:hypothetical protein
VKYNLDLIEQTNIYGDDNTIISNNNINNNPLTIVANIQRRSSLSLEEKVLLRISLMEKGFLLLFVLLSII